MDDPESSREMATIGELLAQKPPVRAAIAGLLQGFNAAEIKDELVKLGHDADNALNEAAEYFANISLADSDVLRGFCLEATREMYRQLVAQGNYEGALKALKMLFQMAPDNV